MDEERDGQSGPGSDMNGGGRCPVPAVLVHVFTALGAAAGIFSLERAFAQDFVGMFVWHGVAFIIDGIDGSIARRVDVRNRTPHIDGDVLDCVVDYLNYVIVPCIAIWQAGLMSPVLAVIGISVVAVGSSIYFADSRMKTADYWFRGFPALWNVVLLYLLVFPLPGWVVFALLMGGTAMMFVPVVFVHPMRVERWRNLTLAVGALWLACAVWAVVARFDPPLAVRVLFALTGLYIVLLPLARHSPWAEANGGAGR